MFSKFFRSSPPPHPSDGSSPKKVYLVMRSQYEVPRGHRILTFDEPGLLAWFQAYWRSARALEKAGAPGQIAMAMKEWRGGAPSDLSQLRKFTATIYSEGGIIFDEHAIQSLHDDDEIDTHWYLFDDVFATRHPERVGYLLREDWQLPETAGTQGLKLEGDLKHVMEGLGEGCVYGVFLSAYDGMTISGITGSFRFDGVRMPGFGNYLAEGKSPLKKRWDGALAAVWPEELLLLRSLVLKSGQESFAGFLQAVDPQDLASRCSEARELNNFRFGLRAPSARKPGSIPIDTTGISDPSRFLEGDAASCEADWQVFALHLQRQKEKSKSSAWSHSMREPLIQASPHLCQVRFTQDAVLQTSSGRHEQATTWAYIFFDDLWLAENPVLGESILRYAAGAEVLKVGEELE